MGKIRIGATSYLSSRPLVYGLTCHPDPDVEFVYDHPEQLSARLERGDLDVALVPSIEYLRGAGAHRLDGPALVARGQTDSIVLLSQEDPAKIRRIAVDERNRTPIAALRILLDKLFAIMPDICVHKATPHGWRDDFDAVLLTGDVGLEHCCSGTDPQDTCLDLGELWDTVFSVPLVVSLWAYNDPHIGGRIGSLLASSRDHSMENLSMLSNGLAKTSSFDSELLHRYFTSGWAYDLDDESELGLKVLEEQALLYQLIRRPRLDVLPVG